MARAAQEHSSLYRQYRPATWAAVRGQSQVTDVLATSVAKGSIAHAYLFAGGRGTGKTSVARILARELGVSDKDLYEMDAASNRGIDDIRQLREGVYALPFESPYKLYIIDEAHMLTKEAWNALLKTLEEPPTHAIFVLATTERDKVPDTIQSRCEIYSFKDPTREMLADMISDVAKKEGHTIERAGAELIALLADGSFRDALSILQKVLAIADKKVTAEDVAATTGAPRGELVRRIVQALGTHDANAALAATRAAEEDNLDARLLTRLVIERMRAVLLMRYAPDIAEQIGRDLSAEDRVLAEALAREPAVNSDTLRALLEAHARMAYAAVPFLPLELAITDICAVRTQ